MILKKRNKKHDVGNFNNLASGTNIEITPIQNYYVNWKKTNWMIIKIILKWTKNYSIY